MRFILLISFLFLSCDQLNTKQTKADKAQDLLDQRKYLRVIQFLEGDNLSNEEASILTDAYIGASGFELLDFLGDIDFALRSELGNEHPVQYLNDIFIHIKTLSTKQDTYFQKALSLASTSQYRDDFKAGVLNLFSVVRVLKGVGTRFEPQLVYNENNQRVLILTNEEKFEMIKMADRLIGALFRTYAHLRLTFKQVRDHLVFLDDALEELLGTEIGDLGDLSNFNAQKALEVFLTKNPNAAKEFAYWIGQSCDSNETLQNLKELKEQLEGQQDNTYFLIFLENLIKEIEATQGSVCDHQNYYDYTYI